MEKTQQEPTFKRSDYLSSDGKNLYCAFLFANDSNFPFSDVKTSIGEGLRQRVEYANIVLITGQRKSSDICHTKGDCKNCETSKDYNRRLKPQNKTLSRVPETLQCAE
jgi:hypothetical protein